MSERPRRTQPSGDPDLLKVSLKLEDSKGTIVFSNRGFSNDANITFYQVVESLRKRCEVLWPEEDDKGVSSRRSNREMMIKLFEQLNKEFERGRDMSIKYYRRYQQSDLVKNFSYSHVFDPWPMLFRPLLIVTVRIFERIVEHRLSPDLGEYVRDLAKVEEDIRPWSPLAEMYSSISGAIEKARK